MSREGDATMAASDTATLIIVGVIGAGGAIVTQIIASVVTSTRDAKRFHWERQKQERDWEIQASERFLNLKQELYSNFIRVVDQYILAATIVISDPDKYGAESKRLPRPRELQQLHTNIELVAPSDVQEAVGDCYGAFLQVAINLKNTDGNLGSLVDEARQARVDVQLALKRDLQGEREVVKHAQAVTVASPSPEEARAWWRRKLNIEQHP
jgi:hypothetical protein